MTTKKNKKTTFHTERTKIISETTILHGLYIFTTCSEHSNHAFEIIEAATKKIRPTHTHWIVIENSCEQPKSKIVFYKKIFKRLKEQGIDFDGVEKTKEIIESNELGIIFRCAIKIDSEVKATIEKIPKSFYNVMLINVEKSFNVEENLEELSCKEKERTSTYNRITKEGGMVSWPFGCFDDRERGAVIFGKSKDIELLLGAVTTNKKENNL